MAAQATVPLEKAKRLEPEKASIREALGIAYFRLARWQDGVRERVGPTQPPGAGQVEDQVHAVAVEVERL